MSVQRSIKFYRVHEPYGEFSNFAPFPIEIDGALWPTSEHYFQAQKFPGTQESEAIRLTASPMIAARMGRDLSKPLRADWEAVKIEIMTRAIQAKVAQHASVRELLLATGEAEIVEHTKNDSFWGDGGDGSGKNMLGKILMAVRAELISGKTSHS